MRFGQGHGAEEAAFDHRLQEQAFLLIAAKAFDQVGGAHGQERISRGPGVGRLEMGKTGLRKQRRQLHAAGLEVAGGVEETGFEEGIDGGFDLGDQQCFAMLVTRLVLVALAVVWREILLGNGPRRVQRGIEGFAVVFGKAWALGEGLGVEHFVEFEGQVAGAEQGLGHDGIPVWGCVESRRGKGGCLAP
ncbi:hypothetical protein D3C78_899230 [compost metagenome]